MAIQPIAQLKQWFRKGLYPTQTQFWDWLDSYRHKNDKIPMPEVEGLADALNNKFDKSEARILTDTVTSKLNDLDGILDEMDDMRDSMEELENTLTDRTYTLDFGHDGTVVQDVNMEAEEVEVLELRLFNVKTLWVTSGRLVRHKVDPVNPQEITIAAGSLATWEIEREGDELAAVGVKCRRTGVGTGETK